MSGGRILSIHRVKSDGARAERLDEATVTADWGLEGDYRSRQGSKRQMTLIAERFLKELGDKIGHAVPDGGSRRQIVTDGLDLRLLIGRRLKIGDVELEVAADCPPCHRMDEEIAPGAREAMDGWGGVCCRVLAGGVLRENDVIEVVTDPLSDR